MDVTTLYSIGELSRRTGLPVRTIRFYSDSGVVAPTPRSPAGYRRYDLDALLRLELLRTLRELGMDLPTIQRVLDRELRNVQGCALCSEGAAAASVTSAETVFTSRDCAVTMASLCGRVRRARPGGPRLCSDDSPRTSSNPVSSMCARTVVGQGPSGPGVGPNGLPAPPARPGLLMSASTERR